MQGQGHLPEQEAKTLRKMVKFMPLDPARLLLRQTLPSHRGGHVTRTDLIRALLLRREPVSSFTEVKLGVLSGSLPPGRVAKGPSPTGERKANTERGAELRAGEGLGWSRGKAGGNEREAEDREGGRRLELLPSAGRAAQSQDPLCCLAWLHPCFHPLHLYNSDEHKVL